MTELLLFLHILGAAAWFGTNVAQVALTASFRRETSPATAAYLRGTVALGTRLYTPASVLVLLTGIGLVLASDTYGFGAVFVIIGFLMVVAGTVLGTTVFGPQGRRAAALRDAGEEAGAVAVERRLAGFGMLDTLLLAFTIATMVWKLGA